MLDTEDFTTNETLTFSDERYIQLPVRTRTKPVLMDRLRKRHLYHPGMLPA